MAAGRRQPRARARARHGRSAHDRRGNPGRAAAGPRRADQPRFPAPGRRRRGVRSGSARGGRDHVRSQRPSRHRRAGRAAWLRRTKPPAAARAGRSGQGGLMPGGPRADRRDFYETLGVPRTPTQDETQRAYRKLARQHHPDVNKDPGAEDRFKEISEAYDVLSDPQTRRRYDAFGPDFRQVPEDVDPEAYQRSRASAGAGRARGAGGVGGFGTDLGGDLGGINIEDLLGGIFAGRGFGPIPGADQEAELELTVEEAFQGGQRSVTLEGPNGRRTLDVKIPAGVTNGQRIRLAGQGGRGSEGAPNGDLYFVVRIAPHSRYRVEGRDLFVELPLAPWEAALGTTAAVETPRGEMKVKVPPGTSTGKRLRLRPHGLPHPRGGAGPLYAAVKIVVPANLTDEERSLFEQLATVSTFDPRRR